jgi:hypothetical protein
MTKSHLTRTGTAVDRAVSPNLIQGQKDSPNPKPGSPNRWVVNNALAKSPPRRYFERIWLCMYVWMYVISFYVLMLGRATRPREPKPLPRATMRARKRTTSPRVDLTRPRLRLRPCRPSQSAAASTCLSPSPPRSCNWPPPTGPPAADKSTKVIIFHLYINKSLV